MGFLEPQVGIRMGSDSFDHYRQAIQDSLTALSGKKQGLSSVDQQRLAEAMAKFSATLKSLERDQQPTSFLSPNLQTLFPYPFRPVEEILNVAPDAHVITSPEGLIQMANYQAAQMLHQSQASLIGQSLSHFILNSDWLTVLEYIKKLEHGTRNWEWVMRISPSGQPPCLVTSTASALRDPEGKLLALHWLLRDFADQQWAHLAGELVQTIGEQVLSGLTLDQTVRLVCRRFSETFYYPLIWIGTKEQDGMIKVRAFAGENNHVLDYYQEYWNGPVEHQSGAARAIQHNKTQHLCEEDLAKMGKVDLLRDQGIQSGLAIPLAIRDRVLGVLNVYAHQPQAFDSGVVQWLERLAAQISLGLFLARDYDHLRLQGAAVSSAAETCRLYYESRRVHRMD